MTSTSQPFDIPERILVEDDQAEVREVVASYLTSAGYECKVADAKNALLMLEAKEKVDLVCCGVTEWSEAEFKRLISATVWRNIPIVVSMDARDVQQIVDVLQKGAYDVLPKPCVRRHLILIVRRALEHRRLKMENLFFRDRLNLGSGFKIPRSVYKDHL